jgi:ribosomal protein L18E
MKGAPLPPGDTHFDLIDTEDEPSSEAEASLWRELSFALFLIRRAVNPNLRIEACLQEWKQIAKDLSEPPRKRRQQIKKLRTCAQF